MLLTAQPGAQELGQSSGSGGGTVFSAVVVSIHGERRRKRTELAVAFDNKLEIFDVNVASRIKEYSLPEQESVTCSPASVRHKRRDGTTQRLSYVASRDGTRTRIHGRIENAKSHSDLQMPTWSSQDRGTHVVAVEVCTSTESEQVGLLVLWEDGQASLFSEDLKTQYWRTPALNHGKVEAVTLLSVDQARSGILKGREDILAMLGSASSLQVLAMVVGGRTDSGAPSIPPRLILAGVRTDSMGTSAETSSTGLQILFEQDIPVASELAHDKTAFRFHKPSGQLIEQGENGFSLYSLGGSVLKRNQTIPVGGGTDHSCLPITSALLAYIAGGSLVVLDTKYGSIRASTSLKDDNDETRPAQRNGGSAKVLAYFAPSNTLVAFESRRILSLRLSSETASQDHRRSYEESTLVAAMGRGVGVGKASGASQPDQYVPPKFGTLVTTKAGTVAWNEVKQQLSKAVKDGRVDDFDDVAIEHFGLRTKANEAKAIRRDLKKIDVLLNTLFKATTRTKAPNESRKALQLRMGPPMTVGWLVQEGHLMQHRIESALRRCSRFSSTESLKPCALIDALYAHDSTLQTLIFYLSSPTYLEASEIARTILLALQVLQQAHTNASATKLIKADAEQSADGDVDMADAAGAVDRVAAASSSSSSASASSPEPEPESEKAHDAHALMRICLSRLAALPSVEVQGAFRSMFSQSVLIGFVDYLRLDLASGGWYSHHGSTDSPQDDMISQPPDHIRTVSLLLSAAIDSLGSAGWLGASSENNIASRVEHMKAEISIALEGIAEARYLQATLSEVLTYAKHDAGPLLNTNVAALAPRATMKQRAPLHDVVTASDGTEMMKPITVGLGSGGERNVLPVGLKPAGAGRLTSTEKPGMGGEGKRRSMRDIGRLKSMQVGAYSFEKIMI